MRKLLFVIISSILVFSSCSKKLEEKNIDHSQSITTLDGIKIPAGFDWSTTKTIDVQIDLPEAEGIKRTKISSIDGSVVYFKGYPDDTTQRVLNTRITVPSYFEVLKVTNGIDETFADITGTALNVDFNNINKLAATGGDCDECDGQITYLELDYIGNEVNPVVKVTQKKKGNHNYVIFEGTVTGYFNFIGANKHNKMGAKIKVYVNNVFNVEIHTSCSQTILAGMEFGDFKIISGESHKGGPLCDVEEDEPVSFSGTLIYEDLYPSKGDYDFNDLVIEYNFEINKKDNNKVEDVTATFEIMAFGASYHNAFGFLFPEVKESDVEEVSGGIYKANTIFEFDNKGLEEDQSKATFIVYDDAFDIMNHPGTGIGVNTASEAPYVTPVTVSLFIEFKNNKVHIDELSIGDFNPFIVMKQDRDYEVHLANHEPTDLFETDLFGTFDDDSNPGSDVYFVTENNLPWAINIPEGFVYMREKAEISTGYLHFVQWAESGGTLYQDWYLDLPGYRNNAQLYPIP